jgi:hypothetical protein
MRPTRRVAAGLLGLALALGAQARAAEAPAALEPPDPATLFGCPLSADAAAFEPPDAWPVRAVEGMGVTVRLPESWEIETSPELVVFRSRDGGDRLTLRRGRLVGSEQLGTVRRTFELRELGPSHAGPRCEAALRERLAGAGFAAVEIGVYARPFGRRQRSYATFAGLGDGSLTAVLTVRWAARSKGPDLSFVRRVLGGIRAAAGEPAGGP